MASYVCKIAKSGSYAATVLLTQLINWSFLLETLTCNVMTNYNSHTTHVICMNFIHERRYNLIYLQCFRQKTVEKKRLAEIIIFCNMYFVLFVMAGLTATDSYVISQHNLIWLKFWCPYS